MNLEFAELIKNGLTSENKYLSSMYFYDDEGSKLFQMITQLPEYYLTKCEYEILETNKNKILSDFLGNDNKFNIVELGSGDGHKTKILLKYFLESNIEFEYSPIDISKEALNLLKNNLKSELKELNINPLVGDYHKVLKKLSLNKDKKIFLFMGSNIGNFKKEKAFEFINFIVSNMNKGDLLLVGFDLKKDPKVILNAYNDSQGVTSRFNLNVLKRINREFDANFDLNNFTHYPFYNPETLECKSYLVSNKRQNVEIKKLNLNIDFKYAEIISTELSRKFDNDRINEIATQTNLKIKSKYYDCREYFVDVLFEK